MNKLFWPMFVGLLVTGYVFAIVTAYTYTPIAVIVALGISVPATLAICMVDRTSAQAPSKKIFYKLPARMLLGSLIAALLIEGLIALTATGEEGLALIIWPIYSPVYLLASALLGLLLAGYFYARSFPRSQRIARWIGAILLVGPGIFLLLALFDIHGI